MIARECPATGHAWRRHAGHRDNDPMPVPPRRLKDLIEGTVDHHASQRWPALEEVTITWRGAYGSSDVTANASASWAVASFLSSAASETAAAFSLVRACS